MACEAVRFPARSNEQQIVPLTLNQVKAPAAANITVHLSTVSVDINNGASRETIEVVFTALKNIC
jgi:hypothetical protein